MPQIRVKRRHPMPMWHDGAVLQVTVKRMSADEAGAFKRAFGAILDPPSKRLVLVRKEGEEQAQQAADHALLDAAYAALPALIAGDEAKDQMARPLALALLAVPRESTYVVSDVEICTRRYREMTEPERAQYDAARDAEQTIEREFYRTELPKYLDLEPGQMAVEEENGVDVPVTTGQQYVELFGARLDLLKNAAHVVLAANTLDDATKKTYGSLSAFTDGSASSDPASGPRPDGAAPVAAPAASAKPAAATAETGGGRSGTTVN